jgi:hypothetical protein
MWTERRVSGALVWLGLILVGLAMTEFRSVGSLFFGGSYWSRLLGVSTFLGALLWTIGCGAYLLAVWQARRRDAT